MNAETFKAVRRKLRMSQQEFGEALGVTQTVISNYENNGIIPQEKAARVEVMMHQNELTLEDIKTPLEPVKKKRKKKENNQEVTDFLIANYEAVQNHPIFIDMVKSRAYDLVINNLK